MVEINHQFKNAGISMFAAENKRLGVVGYPFVGDAVADHLVDFFLKGLDKFKNIDDTAEDALKRIREKKARLKSPNPIKRIKARREGIGEVFTPEEMIKINGLLDDYRDLDGQLWSYNLRDNIVESIIKKFVAEKFGPSFIPYVLREEILPDLRKLGLDDLIGDIKQGLINEMEKDIKNYKEELLPPKERVQIDPKEIDFLPEPDDIEQ